MVPRFDDKESVKSEQYLNYILVMCYSLGQVIAKGSRGRDILGLKT